MCRCVGVIRLAVVCRSESDDSCMCVCVCVCVCVCMSPCVCVCVCCPSLLQDDVHTQAESMQRGSEWKQEATLRADKASVGIRTYGVPTTLDVGYVLVCVRVAVCLFECVPVCYAKEGESMSV
ncbi:MAG: hypothetical protein P4L40_23040 [Terracidiphilus sp.]|nr:hypothetical protein [Terracidiphilus sp.]